MEYDFTAFPACLGTDIYDIVGVEHHVTVVLHHDNSVAQVAQFLERTYQSFVVALVQSYTGFIKDIEHIDQLRTDLCSQSDALAFAAREGC